MVALWYLLILAPVIALAFFWWRYRLRQAAREREAGERWQQLLAQTAEPAPAAIPAAAATLAPAPPQYRGRERLLDPTETLLFFLLRTELPECEILVRVSLDRLLLLPDAVGNAERERRMGALARHVVDFVVCDKSMRPLAAVDLLATEAPAALTSAPDFRMQCLAHSGIRHLQVVRSALPKRQDIRAVVLGL